MNTSAPLFSDQNLSKDIEKNLAEMYSRMYALAAEDFTTTQDVGVYIRSLTEWMRLLQQQISQLMQVISSHTHVIPPHTHPIPPHVHTIASVGAGVTDPNVIALATLPTPLQTNVPIETSAIRWTEVQPPQYVNTTNTTPNKSGNMVIVGPTMVGPLDYVERRAKVPKALLNTTVAPLLKSLAEVT